MTIDDLNPLIRRLVLRTVGGGPLPGFTAGAHVRVEVKLPGGAKDWRHYSLVRLDPSEMVAGDLDEYVIAVRRESDGRGGSLYMHSLQVGHQLVAEPPKNDFPLKEHAGRTVLVAGGIGVTPLTAMAVDRKLRELPVAMVYAGRSRKTMAFLPELRALLGNALTVHADEDAGGSLDVNALLDKCGPSDVLYVCGPHIMLDAIQEAAKARRWAPERVQFELFSAPAAQKGDHPFEVILQQSGQSFQVAGGQTILDCLVANGLDPLSDCQRGECGICAVNVIEGEVDHRDHVLTESEKAGGKVIQICVSRAKGNRLVLDI